MSTQWNHSPERQPYDDALSRALTFQNFAPFDERLKCYKPQSPSNPRITHNHSLNISKIKIKILPPILTVLNPSNTSHNSSGATDMIRVQTRYSCFHSSSAVISPNDTSIDRGPLSHPCMPCSYRRAADAEAEIVRIYQSKIEGLELWIDGLRGHGSVQAFCESEPRFSC